MKATARITALFLLASLILTSCGSGDGKVSETTAPDTAAETTVEETTVDPEPLGLPEELNFDGYKYRAFSRYQDGEITVEAETGNVVDDALWKRERTVEELLGCDIVSIIGKDGWGSTEPHTPILSGDDVYDIVLLHGGIGFSIATEGGTLDWNTIENLDLDRSWWNQDARENLEVAGHLFAMVGGLSLDNLKWTRCLLFSQPLLTDYGIEFPYQLVRDGKWTLEVFESYVKNYSQDLNSDGRHTLENDLLGFAGTGWGSIPALMYTTGTKIITRDDEGLPKLDLYNEKTVDLFDRVFALLDSESGALDLEGELDGTAFKEGRLAFYGANIDTLRYLGDLEMDFGVLPYPKYDEGIDRYYQLVDGGASFAFIPITVKDPATTGAITEALAYYGYKLVYPAYYNNAILNRYVRDEESIEMVELVRNSMVFDLGYINSTEFGGVMFGCPGRNLAENRKLTLTTFYNSYKLQAQKSIEKSIKKYLKLADK